jgi:hypothetical protein
MTASFQIHSISSFTYHPTCDIVLVSENASLNKLQIQTFCVYANVMEDHAASTFRAKDVGSMFILHNTRPAQPSSGYHACTKHGTPFPQSMQD